MSSAIVKVLVWKFYERNAGFFLFIFFLMFGIVESSQIVSYHLSLIAGMLSSPAFFALVCGLWLLYLLKCLQFVISQLASPENEFMFRLNLFDFPRRFKTIFQVLVMIDIPVLLYSFLIVAIAWGHQQLLAGIMVVLFHAVILCAATCVITGRINSPHRRSLNLKLPAIRFPWARPFPFFYIDHLSQHLTLMIAVTKIFSLLCLAGFLQIPLDGYDNRLVFLGILFGLVAHTVIIFELRRFEDRYLQFVKSFPILFPVRFLMLCLVYLMIMLPEAALLYFNNIPIQDIFEMLFSALGFLLITHCYLYKKLDMDMMLRWVLMLFLSSFMLVLWKLTLPVAIVTWSIAYIFLSKNYYQYEPTDL